MAAVAQTLRLTQEGRLFQIETPLDPDTLVVRALSGREALSELYSFDVEFASESFDIDPEALIAKPAVLLIMNEDQCRYVHGYFNSFSLLPTDDHFARYCGTLVPWMWFLTQTSDCCIYQNQSVPEIITSVFEKYGLDHFKLELRAEYPVRKYCVQYRESAYQFVSRLMEEEGISYYFEHQEKTHTVVLVDSPFTYRRCPLGPELEWAPSLGRGFSHDRDYVFEWARRLEVRPARWSMGDYHFGSPRLRLLSVQPTRSHLRVPEFERFDHPGRFTELQDADRVTTLRMEEEEASIDVIAGRSSCRALTPGSWFKLVNHPRRDQNAEYLLLGVEHKGEQGSLWSGETTSEAQYQNCFTVIPRGTPYRPRRITPRPIIAGPQTAFVTGPDGEEIHTDEFGRVKVQFHWDRHGKHDENTSCWVRVSQSSAGKAWGSMHLPRVGQEVIVEFLDGDPDRPLVTGQVYNAVNMPPYPLPSESTKSGWKTCSSKGGGGFNELRFEDAKDKEQVFLHAEKDLDIRVKNDRKELIQRDRHLVVKRDRLANVGRDEHTETARDQVMSVGRDRHLDVKGKEAAAIGGSKSLKVQGDVIEEFKGNQSTQVSNNLYVKGMQLVLEAATGITLKVGGNFITIDSSGVAINGTLIQLNSAGAALSGNSGSLVPPLAATAALEACNAGPGSNSKFSAQAREQLNIQREDLTPKRRSAASNAPTHNPTAAENREKKHWIEIELVDEAGQAVPGEPYLIVLPDGTTVADGTTDQKGRARVDGIDAGTCQVTFPNLDKAAWVKA